MLNGDLGTIDTINPDNGSLTVRLDRDPETRELPSWYLDQEHVDYGYALTGHKAQGVTTGRTFTVIDGGTNREWAYVAMSRGRHANTLYLVNPEPDDEHCEHVTHPERSGGVDELVTALNRTSQQTAAIDRFVELGRGVGAHLDAVESPPPSSDVAERVAWMVARRRAERNEPEHSSPDVELAAER